MIRKLTAVAVCCGTLAATALPTSLHAAAAQSGSVDPSFGKRGKVVTAVGPRVFAAGVAAAPGGGSYVAGNLGPPGANLTGGRVVVARYDKRGRLVRRFGRRGIAKVSLPRGAATVRGIAVQADGHILLVGSVAGDVMLARLTRTGKLDQAFSDDGVEMSDFGTSYDNATDLALQPDGFVVVVGASGAGFPASGVPGDAFVARYRPDGTPDPTFGASGRVVLGRAASDAYLDAQAVALLPDGSILVGGNAGVTQRDGNAAAIALLRPNGTPDTRLGPLGISYPGLGDGVLYDLVRDRRSGRVYIAGTVRTETGPEFFLMALSPDLSRDDSFGEFGVVRSSLSGTSGEFATTAVVDGKGRVLLAGTTLRSSTPKSMGSFAVARFLDTGQVDNGFGHRGWVRTSFARGWSVARAVLLQRGRLLAVGNKASTELWSTGSVITLARYRLGG